MAHYLDIFMFATALVLILRGYPVAFTLGGVAILFSGIGYLAGVFDTSFFLSYPKRIFGTMTNDVLVAVPLFIFMGVMLERSKVAEELLETMGLLFGSMRGGLGLAVSFVGMLLAASTGIVGATVVTMGLLSLPTMLKRGYDPRLACGSICAAGTLGQIIPPSIVLVILGDQISSSYTAARLAVGDFSPEPVSVGDLFAGALIPGLMLVGFYMVYQVGYAIARPESSPAIPAEERTLKGWALAGRAAQALIPPLSLIVAVLGSILAGIATPTEAAAVGAVGSILLAGIKLHPGQPRSIYAGLVCLVAVLVLTGTTDLRLTRNEIAFNDWIAIYVAAALCLGLALAVLYSLWIVFERGVLQDVMRSSTHVTTMVFVILIGASLFSLVFRALGGEELVEEFLTSMPGGEVGAIIVVMLIVFLLGFFLDFLEIVFVVVPLVAPVLFKLGYDPVWLGIMFAVNLQTSFLTPPFGFALFYLRGVAPPSVTTMMIYKGVIPFVFMQVLMLVVLWFFPGLATWLPNWLYG